MSANTQPSAPQPSPATAHPIPGLHHITAIARDARANVVFYGGVLGLRLVKKTVNFDDPGTYHLYYGDQGGSPGSILTFFPWAQARLGAMGRGQASAISFGVPAESLEFWTRRLKEAGLEVGEAEIFGEKVRRFRDGDGLVLELVGSVREGDARRPWSSAEVGAAEAIRGFDGVTLLAADPTELSGLLDLLGYRQVADEAVGRRRVRFEAPGTAGGRRIDVVVDPTAPLGHVAAGSVHHLALRVADDPAQAFWQDRLAREGFWPTEVKDRNYFRSIYFREPGGVLFELATDTPGFAIDEKGDELGSRLMLPAWLESRRERITAALPVLPVLAQGDADHANA